MEDETLYVYRRRCQELRTTGKLQRIVAVECLLILLLSGCGMQARDPVALVDHVRWERSTQGVDPFSAEATTGTVCQDRAWGFEDFGGQPSFGVDTLDCDYLTVQQELTVNVDAGDTLMIKIWKFEITITEPAMAHVGIAVDSDIVWEEHVQIPSDSELIKGEVSSPRDYTAGTKIFFHVDNHGSNSWSLLEVMKIP